ncbi:MAG: Nudix family hydrolase [Proteobacteria bacterium]|nr:Nudix family hydrolase [Burkholderiales bacterium]
MSPLRVVAGVIERADGRVLIAQRPPGKAYAGYWEFPGGKIEPGESAHAAIVRELAEELALEVRTAYPWLRRRFTYPHATVELRFFRIAEWSGALRGCEGQQISWESVDDPQVAPMLPANGPVLAGLRLPLEYALTQAMAMGIDAQLQALERALRRGLRLVQVREPGMDDATLERFARAVVSRAHASGARVLINGDLARAQRVGADGVHLRSAQLRTLSSRPEAALIGASCHDQQELAAAYRLGCDFAALGPVQTTATHPGAIPLGWERFASLACECEFPVYALGGLNFSDLDRARAAGAHGTALQRAAWRVS